MYLGQEEPDLFGGLQAAGQDFVTGNIAGAASSLSSLGLIEMGLVTGPVGAAIGAAIGVGVSLLHLIGRGRREADLIVPVQNAIDRRLDEINRAIPTSVNVQQLQSFIAELRAIAHSFMEFVSRPQFTDGRASAQAANDTMKLIDGSCGYEPHNLRPTRYDCGPPEVGYPGGLIEAAQHRILQLGAPMLPPLVTQGAGGGFLPTLEYHQEQSYPWIPQAGTIAANAPQYPLEPQKVQTVSLAGLASSPLLLLLLGGVVLSRIRR